ncbi:MAG: bifunctional nicotinamidase/pyrazinamidase [Treponema sp.]|nr:bifunctional nicotinamidase/pyrazinamidase [Treponema sp.]
MKFNYASAALLIIDVQNDFCPAGALAVKDGDEVIQPLNRAAALFSEYGAKVIATQDWHPGDHVSFASSHPGRNPGDVMELPGVKEQVLWPDHCIAGTAGADIHGKLDLSHVHMILRKGFRRELDSYSAFFENDKKTSTGLGGMLADLGIKNLFLGGLALDYCVFYSAVDAVRLGYKTAVLTDAVRGVDIPAGSAEKALQALEKAGVSLINSADPEFGIGLKH